MNTLTDLDKNGVNPARICEQSGCNRQVENPEFFWCCACFNLQSPETYVRNKDGKWCYGSDGVVV